MLSTFLVTNALDPRGAIVRGSLRWAVAQANLPGNQGSTVEITPAVQSTITLRAGEVAIRSSLTIENDSGVPLTIQQGSANSRVFHIFSNTRTTAVTITGLSAISPLTLTGGNVRNGNGGAILVDNPKNILTLAYVNVVGNSAAQVNNPRLGAKGNGGGIYSSGTVTLEHASVSFNSANGPNAASGHAGGVYTDQGVTLIASQVNSNAARNSAGILNVYGSVEVLDGSTVNNNSSYGNSFDTGDFGGGGISEMAGNVIVSASQVNNNKALGMYSAGIVSLLGGVTATDGSQIDGNSANGPGGGIAANFEGAVTISNGSQVDDNSGSGVGGGIVNFSNTFGINIIGQSQVSGNTLTNGEDFHLLLGLTYVGLQPSTSGPFVSGGRGDAMLKSALQLFVNACAQRAPMIQQAVDVFGSDLGFQGGAGISSELSGPIVVSGGSTISDNGFAATTASKPANGFGGGVFGNLGSITIDNSTISGNTTNGAGLGGGVYGNLGPITIDGSTITTNIATSDGGGIWNGSSLSISNSLVTLNQAGMLGGGIFNQGTFTSSSTSVVDNTPDDIYPNS